MFKQVNYQEKKRTQKKTQFKCQWYCKKEIWMNKTAVLMCATTWRIWSTTSLERHPICSRMPHLLISTSILPYQSDNSITTCAKTFKIIVIFQLWHSPVCVPKDGLSTTYAQAVHFVENSLYFKKSIFTTFTLLYLMFLVAILSIKVVYFKLNHYYLLQKRRTDCWPQKLITTHGCLDQVQKLKNTSKMSSIML